MMSNTPKPRVRPRKSAVTLGIKQTARVSSKRAIKQTCKPVKSPLLKLVTITALGAIASYFINKD